MTDEERRNAAQLLLQQRRLAKADLETVQKRRGEVWKQPDSPQRDTELTALAVRIKELSAHLDDVDRQLAALIPNEVFGKYQRVTMSNFN